MTNKKLFDELSALKIHKLSVFLCANKEMLLNASTTLGEFTKEVSSVSATLPPEAREKVETILAYTYKETYAPEAFELLSSYEVTSKDDNGRAEDAKHLTKKRTSLQHNLNHVSEELLTHPKNPELAAKQASMKKQQHILGKKE